MSCYFTQPRPLSWASPGHFTVQDKTHMDWLVADLGSLHTLTLSSKPQEGTRTECLVASWKKIGDKVRTHAKSLCNRGSGTGAVLGKSSGTRRTCKFSGHQRGEDLCPVVVCISLISFTQLINENVPCFFLYLLVPLPATDFLISYGHIYSE